jgi:NADPH2:quinone reductase
MGQRVVIDGLGETPLQAIDQLARLVPMARPDPSTLGPRDVVVEVASATVGWVDLLMASGQYQHVPQPPYTPGLEYAGTVSWAGSDATGAGIAVGARVMIDPFLAGPRSSGAHRAYGGFASYAVAPCEAVHALPGVLTFDQACNLLGNYETAYHCLLARGRLQAGETVLIHGASGSVGLAAVHVAKLVGATVIATGRSADKLAIVKEQGADHVICVDPAHPARVSLRDEVKQLTGGRGVDMVYDGVGGALSGESLRCVRFGARYLIVGWAATPAGANPLATNLIMMKGLDVLGCPTVISTLNDPSLRVARLAQVLAWASAGQLVPYVSRTYPLSEFRAALHAKWRGDVCGGIVLHP